MKQNATAARVQEITEAVIAAEGYELLDVEYVMERGKPVVRMYIDTVPPSTPERGVSVEDCTHVSRTVSDVLDVEDAVPGEYNLEVSSPGLFRPLTKPAHFARATGERVRVKTFDKIDDRRVFVGTLVGGDDDALRIDVDGTTFTVPLADVAKANLEPLLDF